MPLTESGLYVAEDISFVNTAEFSKSGKDFIKNRVRDTHVYTKAPKGSREYKEFWDIEEDRRRNGMTLPGKLIVKNGITSIQEVHITGEHYGYLNYAQIMKTKDIDVGGVVKLTKQQMKAATKIKAFPDFWDEDYHWFVAKEFARSIGKHIIGMKARRKGFSYKEGWDSADTINLHGHVTVLLCAYDYKYLTAGNQIFNMARNYLDFLEMNTDFNRGYLKATEDTVELGYYLEGDNKKRGYQSRMLALSFGPANPDVAIGKDAVKIKIEEIGKAPNLLAFLAVTMSSTEAGSRTTGQISMFGTGGTRDANWENAETIFYNPAAYNCLPFDNVWDDGMQNTPCGFFYPNIKAFEPFIDEHGNSNIAAALEYDVQDKENVKKTVQDVTDYNVYVGQRANKPSESFLRTSNNIFSSIELADHINYVKNSEQVKFLHRAGILKRNTDTQRPEFITNDTITNYGLDTHPPVWEYPHKVGTDVTGCIVEWFSPYRDPLTGIIPSNLYRIWNDPVAFDRNKEAITTKDSLGATYVFERANTFTPTKGDVLVACYVGRTEQLDDYNEMLLRLTEYYNGICMFENDRGDVKPFFKRKKKYHLLADEPEFNWKKEFSTKKTGRDKGIMIGDNLNRKGAGAMYLKDWLYTIRGVEEDGTEKMNLHYIYDLGLLTELAKWNLKGNFDRVSALIVGMFDMWEQFDREINQNTESGASNFFRRSLF